MSILRRQLVWGLPAQGHQVIHFFPLVEVSASVKQLGNVHQGGSMGGVLGQESVPGRPCRICSVTERALEGQVGGEPRVLVSMRLRRLSLDFKWI